MTDRYKLFLDIFWWSLAGYLAYVLRLEDLRGGGETHLLWLYLLVSSPIKAVVAWYSQLNHRSWPKTGVRDLKELAVMIGVGTLPLVILTLAFRPIPNTIPILDALLALFLMSGTRLLVRLNSENRRSAGVDSRRIMIAGAGEAGIITAREMLRHPDGGLVPVAFLDDDRRKHRKSFCGIPVVGSIGQMGELARQAQVEELIIAMPSADGQQIRRVVNLAREVKLPHRIIPGVYELLNGSVTINEVRDVNLEDVLRRRPIQLHVEEISNYLHGATVLITGAGGSIGSEIVRQIVPFRPGRIILFGRGENSIFAIQQELNRMWPDIAHYAIIGDIRHSTHMQKVFERFHPEVVIHAAAHKHVPLMEDSPSEALYNNVMGTRVLAELSLQFGVKRFVNISTDKAVNPTSVMGSTKRLAEMVIASAAVRAKPDQAFVSVRFGNVLGSRGSVVPTFMAQIRAGGPVTVTDPEMTRYFMLIPEAARLVLQAGGLAQNGRIYVLKMGDSVKIVDLARDVIRLSGAKDIDIVFSGIRPGEKLYEELLTNDETLESTTHEDIYIVKPNDTSPDVLREQLMLLENLARNEEYEPLRKMLRSVIPESMLEIKEPHQS